MEGAREGATIMLKFMQSRAVIIAISLSFFGFGF